MVYDNVRVFISGFFSWILSKLPSYLQGNHVHEGFLFQGEMSTPEEKKNPLVNTLQKEEEMPFNELSKNIPLNYTQ